MSSLRTELIQVAAVAVAIVSIIDKQSTGLAFDAADDAVWDYNYQRIMTDITKERMRQEAKWGIRYDEDHDAFWWLSVLGEEVGEANKAVLESLADSDNWFGWPETEASDE